MNNGFTEFWRLPIGAKFQTRNSYNVYADSSQLGPWVKTAQWKYTHSKTGVIQTCTDATMQVQEL